MRFFFLAALLTSVIPISAIAQDRADTPAIRLIEDIFAGRSVKMVAGRPELTDLELTEIARLAGCHPSNDLHQEALVPIIDWNCSNNPNDSRTVTLYLTNDGVSDLLVQPLVANFRATAIALEMDELPSRSAIVRGFLRAIRTGEDPTLGGLVPITETQLARLESAQGKRAQKMSGSGRTSRVYLWSRATSQLGMPLITDLRFDQDGRPIGLVISHGVKR